MQDPHTSTEQNGSKLAQWIVDNKGPKDFAQIILHSLNPVGRRNMHQILRRAGFNAVEVPFYELLKNLR